MFKNKLSEVQKQFFLIIDKLIEFVLIVNITLVHNISFIFISNCFE